MMRLADQMALKRYKGPGFDRIRVIAALIVLVHHCTAYITPNIAHDVLFSFSRGTIQFGLLAVSIFFSVSGFLVTPGLSYRGDITAFAVHRFLRIMPALVVNVIITVLVVGPLLTTLPLKEYYLDQQTYRYLNNLVFRTTTMLPGVQLDDGTSPTINGPLWTLYFEALSYITLVALFILGILTNRKACIGILLAAYIANIIFWLQPDIEKMGLERIAVFTSLFVYFFTGVTLSIFSKEIPYDYRIASLLLIMTAVALPLGLGIVILPISVSYIAVYVGYSDILGKRPFKTDYSYGIYLNHALVITVLMVLLPTFTNFLAVLTVVTVSAFVIAALSWRFIESPSLHLKTRISEVVRRQLGYFLVKRNSVS